MDDKMKAILSLLTEDQKAELREMLGEAQEIKRPRDAKPVNANTKQKRYGKRKTQIVDDPIDEVIDDRPIKRRRKPNSNRAGKIQSIKATTPLGKRKNLFTESDDFNADKYLVKEDKRLWANKKPIKRPGKSKLVWAECNACGVEEEVSPALVFRQDGEIVFTCDECVRKKRG
jgi:hypothetical protein